MQLNQKKVHFSSDMFPFPQVKDAIQETAEAHADQVKRIQEFITENPIAIELVDQIFFTYVLEKKIMESYEAHLAEIQSLLQATEEVKVPQKDDQSRHREAKTFDQLSVDEKMKLVAFNVRMSQARDLDLVSGVKLRRAPKLKDGKPQLPLTYDTNRKNIMTNNEQQSTKHCSLAPVRNQRRVSDKVEGEVPRDKQ